MATAVQICSNALQMEGDLSINSFDENTERAALAKNLYPLYRDAVLRSHPWNCVKKRVAIAPTLPPPDFGWQHRFLLPGDWLRVLNVGREGERHDYELEGRYILCDDNPCYLRYTFRNENEGSWDAMLVQAMTMCMAAAFAYPITKSTTQSELEERRFLTFMKTVRSVDGQEVPPETFGDFPLFQSRSISRV